MPENVFSSRNSGRGEDAVQNHKHLDEMTTEELKDALSDMWDGMDETSFDPAQMDAYLAELENREPISPDFDVDASLAAFHEKHARLFEQLPPVPISTVTKPVRRRRWRTSLVAAIVAVVMMLCSMVTAQAFGLDVFGAIARWTEEIFHFSISTQPPENQQNMPTPATDGEFSTLQGALDVYGILEPVAPTWIPDGFILNKVTATPQVGVVGIRSSYLGEDATLSITIRKYDSIGGMNNATFEKDEAGVTIYEMAGIAHYIITNNERLTATWVAGEGLICSISGDLTIAEMQQIINSIYEG